ncbi:conserved hypothetical protein [Marivirga sericea]|uniref:SnoaL-like domain-containing protein n=1 Tax=Marivirga sericea TaxID=1028 RepID=A0A1X7KFE6_9BACT|nr:SgcJ/EcaC family oxidoreductase [Marivirga sericea]SMG39628.1 conserved hypothetical protein [Marivirga sericea]
MKNLTLLLVFAALSHILMAQDNIYSPARFGRAATPADEDKIIELMDNYSMGWMSENARMVASTFTENGTFSNSDPMIKYGRENIEEYLDTYFKENTIRAQTSGGRISYRYIEDNVVVYHSFTRGTPASSETEKAFPETHSTFVLHKTDKEGWKIVHHVRMEIIN